MGQTLDRFNKPPVSGSKAGSWSRACGFNYKWWECEVWESVLGCYSCRVSLTEVKASTLIMRIPSKSLLKRTLF